MKKRPESKSNDNEPKPPQIDNDYRFLIKARSPSPTRKRDFRAKKDVDPDEMPYDISSGGSETSKMQKNLPNLMKKANRCCEGKFSSSSSPASLALMNKMPVIPKKNDVNDEINKNDNNDEYNVVKGKIEEIQRKVVIPRSQVSDEIALEKEMEQIRKNNVKKAAEDTTSGMSDELDSDAKIPSDNELQRWEMRKRKPMIETIKKNKGGSAGSPGSGSSDKSTDDESFTPLNAKNACNGDKKDDDQVPAARRRGRPFKRQPPPAAPPVPTLPQPPSPRRNDDEQRNVIDIDVNALPPPDDSTVRLNSKGQDVRARVKEVEKDGIKSENTIIYFMTLDGEACTNVLRALREYKKLITTPYAQQQCEPLLRVENGKDGQLLLGMAFKPNLDEFLHDNAITDCLRMLVKLLNSRGIKHATLLKDMKILRADEWIYVIRILRGLLRESDIIIEITTKNTQTPSERDRTKIIQEVHESIGQGHAGMKKSYLKLRRNFNWIGMKTDVENFIRACEACQRYKLVRRKTKYPMLITQPVTEVFERVDIDFYTPAKCFRTKYDSVFTIQDALSRYSIAVPMKNTDGKAVAEAFIQHVILPFGTPKIILSDNGLNFMSTVFKEMAAYFRIKKITTSAYLPRSNGAAERAHHVFTEYLKIYVNEHGGDWHKWIKPAMAAYNNNPHESTGFSPNELVFGRNLRMPSDFPPEEEFPTFCDMHKQLIHRLKTTQGMAIANIAKAKVTGKFYYDRKTNVKEFRVGQMVWVHNEERKSKLDPENLGPFEILELVGERDARLADQGRKKDVYHFDKLLPAFFQEFDHSDG